VLLFRDMNPDKLFDYLDGKLPDHERQALEARLMSDANARREFDVARRIHASMRENQSDRPEILSEMSEETAARGRRMARQVGLAFIVLVAMNVLLGLVYIAHHESKNPNRQLLNEQAREDLRQSLEKAAAATLTPPPLGVSELRITTERGQSEAVADEMVRAAQKFLGSATKGVPDDGRIEVLAEIPPNHAADFKNSLALLFGVKEVNGEVSTASSTEKISIILQLTEAK
jgi:anti-sigma factor RsiW